MNYFKTCVLLLTLLVLFLAACTHTRSNSASSLQEWMSRNGKLKVLCTTSMIADIVREIGKDQVDCLTLIQGESDPHSYQLVKGDDEKLARADLLFYSGLGLEHGPSLAERLKSNPKAFAIGDFLAKVRPQDIITYNGSLDPHVWMDVSLWQESIPFITEKLSEARPEQEAFFKKNGHEVEATLTTLHLAILERFAQLPENVRYLVSAHEAFNYFVRAYIATPEERLHHNWMVRSMAPEGLAPDSQLSTADIQRLVDHIIEYKVTTLFAESNVSRDSLRKLTDAVLKKGHFVHVAKEPLYVDAMGPVGSGAETYIGMMRYDAEIIANGLGKKDY